MNPHRAETLPGTLHAQHKRWLSELPLHWHLACLGVHMGSFKFIFFRPHWTFNVKPNCNGLPWNIGKVNMLQTFLIFNVCGGPSKHQDPSSTTHWAGQLSTDFRSQNGTGLSVKKLCSILGFATDPLYSPILGKAERNNDLLKYHSPNPGPHGIEITHQTFTYHPLPPDFPVSYN